METVRVIDWDAPANNDFLLASQLWITGDGYKRRTDLIGFVNGLPLVFVELKASHRQLKDACDRNLRDYWNVPRHLADHLQHPDDGVYLLFVVANGLKLDAFNKTPGFLAVIQHLASNPL